MDKLVLPAKLESLDPAVKFIKERAEKLGFAPDKVYHIELAAEEIIVNVINYAYPGKEGDFEITCTAREGKSLEVEVIDWGIHFNPLEKEDPKMDISVQERQIGGLGIYLVRQNMDEVVYKREGDRNILYFRKDL